MKKISKIWIVVAVVAIVAAASFLLSGNKKTEQVAFVTEAVAPANIENSITATGTIEPVTSVTVGTQVSGIVSKLYVDYNSVVKKRAGNCRTRQNEPYQRTQYGQGQPGQRAEFTQLSER